MVTFPHGYKLLQRTPVCLELNPQEASMGSSSIASFTPPNTIYPKGSTLPLNMTCSHKWNFPAPLLRATLLLGTHPSQKSVWNWSVLMTSVLFHSFSLFCSINLLNTQHGIPYREPWDHWGITKPLSRESSLRIEVTKYLGGLTLGDSPSQ